MGSGICPITARALIERRRAGLDRAESGPPRRSSRLVCETGTGPAAWDRRQGLTGGQPTSQVHGNEWRLWRRRTTATSGRRPGRPLLSPAVPCCPLFLMSLVVPCCPLLTLCCPSVPCYHSPAAAAGGRRREVRIIWMPAGGDPVTSIAVRQRWVPLGTHPPLPPPLKRPAAFIHTRRNCSHKHKQWDLCCSSAAAGRYPQGPSLQPQRGPAGVTVAAI